MTSLYRKINKLWRNYAPNYFWGDPLDVRFYICKKLSEIKNKKILDVGCGAGIILTCLDDSNEIYGIDINQEALTIAKQLNPRANLENKSWDELLSNEKMDIIMTISIIEFATDRKKTISMMAGKLEKGGRLILTTPNGNNAYYKKLGKRNLLNLNELRDLFEDDFYFKIYGWNPFPIQADHVLKYLPGIFGLLEWLMEKEVRKEKCVAFYVEATKKNN